MASTVTGAIGLSGRYATALFELADEQKELDQVADDLSSVGAMLEDSDDLRRMIRSPVISKDDQQKAMQALLDAAGIGALTRNFIGVVIENRRLFALPGMIKGYLALLARARGEATAEVVSAKPLTDAQSQAIMDSLRKAVGTKVTIDAKVDETLLGGLVVKVGSRMVDTSLKTKLSQLRLAMKGVG
ncbi:MAG: F0F1 ATP synthase subunit delta [Rhodospirillaceae bacterium]